MAETITPNELFDKAIEDYKAGESPAKLIPIFIEVWHELLSPIPYPLFPSLDCKRFTTATTLRGIGVGKLEPTTDHRIAVVEDQTINI